MTPIAELRDLVASMRPSNAEERFKHNKALMTLNLMADTEKKAISVQSAASSDGTSEAYAQSLVRLDAADCGVWLTRNNVGVLKDRIGRPVRYGLANESKEQNTVLKSADLIGLKPVTIMPNMVGGTIGQFVSREVKPAGWGYKGRDREPAQLAWADLINRLGGDAKFATGRGSFLTSPSIAGLPVEKD